MRLLGRTVRRTCSGRSYDTDLTLPRTIRQLSVIGSLCFVSLQRI